MKLFYLATPYSKYIDGLEAAYMMACDNAAYLLEKGVPVFSPIAHTHSIAKSSKVDPRDATFWLDCDWPILSKCDGLIVVKAHGWEVSHGMIEEIYYAEQHHMPMFFMKPMTMPEGLRKAVWE